MDLTNKYNEGKLKQPKADKAVAALSEIIEEEEDIFEKALEQPEPPKKSLAEINKGYRQFYGLPEPGQKSLREEYGTSDDVDLDVSIGIKTPTTARRYRQARAKVSVMPAITDSPGLIMEEDEDPKQEVEASCAVASDGESETGEVVVYDTYTASSVPLSSSSPSTPAGSVAPSPSCGSSRWAGSSILEGRSSSDIDQSLFATFSGIHIWDDINPPHWGFSGIHIIDVPPQSEVAVYTSPYTSPDDVSSTMPGAYPTASTLPATNDTSRRERTTKRAISWFSRGSARKASASSQASNVSAHGQMSGNSSANISATESTQRGFFGSIRSMFKGTAKRRS